jgi:hypothetical protein
MARWRADRQAWRGSPILVEQLGSGWTSPTAAMPRQRPGEAPRQRPGEAHRRGLLFLVDQPTTRGADLWESETGATTKSAGNTTAWATRLTARGSRRRMGLSLLLNAVSCRDPLVPMNRRGESDWLNDAGRAYPARPSLPPARCARGSSPTTLCRALAGSSCRTSSPLRRPAARGGCRRSRRAGSFPRARVPASGAASRRRFRGHQGTRPGASRSRARTRCCACTTAGAQERRGT